MDKRHFFPLFFISLGFFYTLTAFAATPFTHSFGRGTNDKLTGGEVTRLQQILSKDKTIYPEGIVSGYFGPATERALQRWQARNKIVSSGTPATTGYGFVGRKTRAVLNGGAIPVDNTTSGNTPFKMVIFPNTIDIPKPVTVSAMRTNQLSILFPATATTSVSIKHVSVPTGISVSVPSTCYSPCLLANKITVSRTVSEGEYPVTVQAMVGKESVTATYKIHVNPPNDFAFSVHASGQIFVQKSISGSVSGHNQINVSLSKGDPRVVTITQQAKVRGITLSNLGTCTVPCAKPNTVTVGLDVPSGIYPIAVNVAGGGATTSMSYTVNVAHNPNFGFHLSMDDKDKMITVTQPASQAVSVTVPVRILLDGGSPRMAQLSLVEPLAASGISASLSATSCLLPCEPSLTMIVHPQAKIGSGTATVKALVEYTDENGKKISLSKTISATMKVILGNSGTVEPWAY